MEEAASKLGMSRSEFFSRAAEHWIGELADKDLTERINASLEGIDQGEGREFLDKASRRVIGKAEW